MKLYKFRSLDNFKYTEDIIRNKRLYAADFRKLNDPMEGAFKLLPSVDKRLRDAIIEQKLDLKVCSLCEEMKNPLMWAHYANNFQGICIEIEISEDKVTKLDYKKDILNVTNQLNNADNWAKKILTTKFQEWKYEKEWRILTNNNYVKDINITAIYLGIRISKEYIEKLSKYGVPICKTKINHLNKVIEINCS